MIAVGFGHDISLKKIRSFYALRTHQNYIDGIKSAQRDEAAAFDSDEYRYFYGSLFAINRVEMLIMEQCIWVKRKMV